MKLLRYCLLLVAFFSKGVTFSQAQPICYETNNEVKQAIGTYIYLARSNPVHFFKNLDEQTFAFPQLRSLKEALAKTNTDRSETDRFFAFNAEQYQLQGNLPGQSVTVSDILNSKQKWPQNAAFTISDSPHFPARTLLVLSGDKALGVRVVAVDRCLRAELLFDSQVFNNSDRPLPCCAFERPIRRVVIEPKGSILLYEEGTNKPYNLQALVRAFKAIVSKQK